MFTVLAQFCDRITPEGLCVGSDVVTLKYFETIFKNIVGVAIGFAGIAFFVMLLVGGFKYMSAGGDPKAMEGARGSLTSAILGLVLVSLSYLVLVIISKFTGVDLTIFKVYIP